MKITRSSKCYFKKFITKKKQEQLELVMKEYSKIVNQFIGKLVNKIRKIELGDFVECKIFKVALRDKRGGERVILKVLSNQEVNKLTKGINK